jgi:hypothetical protein
MVEADRQGALLELLALDALPYGSPAQKCEARYQAGKIMWDEAGTMKANAELMKDAAKAEFQKNLEKNARVLLAAAANAPVKSSSKDLAKAQIDRIGPDPEEKAAKDAAEKETQEKGAADAAPGVDPAFPNAGK